MADLISNDKGSVPAEQKNYDAASSGGPIIIGRGGSQVHVGKFDGANWTGSHALADFIGDGQGWGEPQYYSTLRAVSCQGKTYIIGRGGNHIHMACYDGSTWTQQHACEAFIGDGQGWGEPQYYSTLKAVACQGKIYYIGRGGNHVHVACFDPASGSWSQSHALEGFIGDGQGWGEPQYYSTLRAVSCQGKIYLIGRGGNHVHVGTFDPASGSWSQSHVLEAFIGDGQGWGESQYYSTLRAVSARGKIFLIGRGANHVHVGTFDPATGQWAQSHALEGHMTDNGGWADAKYHSTIRAI